jgi:hypothetical protein
MLVATLETTFGFNVYRILRTTLDLLNDPPFSGIRLLLSAMMISAIFVTTINYSLLAATISYTCPAINTR